MIGSHYLFIECDSNRGNGRMSRNPHLVIRNEVPETNVCSIRLRFEDENGIQSKPSREALHLAVREPIIRKYHRAGISTISASCKHTFVNNLGLIRSHLLCPADFRNRITHSSGRGPGCEERTAAQPHSRAGPRAKVELLHLANARAPACAGPRSRSSAPKSAGDKRP